MKRFICSYITLTLVAALPLISSAQLRIDTLTGLFCSTYLPERDLVVRGYLDGITFSHPDFPERTEFKKYPELENLRGNYQVFSVRGEIVVIAMETKSVFHIQNDSLKRTDLIPHPKMTINSAIIQTDSTIFLSGGYGLWSARAFLLWLNPLHFRWNPVETMPVNSLSERSNLPPGLSEHIALAAKGEIFLFHGNTVDQGNPLREPLNRGVWALEQHPRRWMYRGELNNQMIPESPVAALHFPFKDHHLILPDANTIVELFADENRAVLYQLTLFSQEMLRSHHPYLKPVHRNGRIYYYRKIEDANDSTSGKHPSYEFTAVPEEHFFGKKVGTYRFYDPGWSAQDLLYWLLGILLVAGVAVFVKLIYRYSGLAELTGTGIRFKGRNYDLNPELHLILEKLLDSEGPVSSNDLLDLVKNPNLKYAHNNRMKNQVIRNLNDLLRSIFNGREDLITSSAADNDKRFRWYQLDKSRFKRSGKVHHRQGG